ncbi:MAG: 30S ribosomal protein S13 [Candidatus Omnitrophica bacterium]|nr:30S ribosomal protein S13 [Candidatus Omnitrophota bacterium]
MPRIIGIDLPNKRMEIALTYIYGVGRATAAHILKETGVSPDKRANELTDEEVNSITSLIQERYQVEGDLRRMQVSNIKRLMSINTYTGLRHKKNLPARGQRTRTNARTRKGPKKGIGGRKR